MALLLLFVIIATLSSHRYWEFAEAAARRAQDKLQKLMSTDEEPEHEHIHPFLAPDRRRRP